MIRKLAAALAMVYIPIILMSIGISATILLFIHVVISTFVTLMYIGVELKREKPEINEGLLIFWLPILNVLFFSVAVQEFIKSETYDDIAYDVYNFYPFKQIRSFYHNITQGVENLLKWRKVIWNDRDWDSGYIFQILLFKFENMETLFNSDRAMCKNAKRDAKRIMVAKNLCKRIVEDDYLSNALIDHNKKYGEDFKFEFEPIEGKTGFGKLVDNRCEDEKKMFSKASEHSDYMKQQDIEYLFKYLKKHIQSWWD